MTRGSGCSGEGACVSHSAVSGSLRPHGLQPARLLCPWDSPGKDTGLGCHALLRGAVGEARPARCGRGWGGNATKPEPWGQEGWSDWGTPDRGPLGAPTSTGVKGVHPQQALGVCGEPLCEKDFRPNLETF